MSIFFDFDVGPNGRRFRRAVDGDKQDIELILDRKHTENIFGVVDIGSLIELSVLSICMINEDKDVMGFMALNDYPNVPGVDPADWEPWIRNMFQRFYISRNTLFIHFMCCKDEVRQFFLSEAFASVFWKDNYLLNIVLMVSNWCLPENLARYQVSKKRNMCKYMAVREDDSEKRLHHLYTALRQDHCPKLRIRNAVEEDNDDICDILDKKCPRLKELYGEYYISEILSRHPESRRRIIVAQLQDRAVGVMCLNPEINYKQLQSIYDLRPYYGLKKATALEKEQLKRSNVLLSNYGEPIMMGKWSPFEQPPKLGKIDERNSDISKDDLYQEKVRPSKNKVIFKQKSPLDLGSDEKMNSVIIAKPVVQCNSQECRLNIPETVMDQIVHASDEFSDRLFMHSPSNSLTSAMFLDEDPFEYDIVNIDESLLNLVGVPTDNVRRSRESSQQSRPSDTQAMRKRRRSIYAPLDENSKPFIYRGGPNAFMIELFGLREDIDERSGFDLLEVAFEAMKDYDYCIIRVPSADKSFSLLQHFCLVPTKSRVCCVYSLYVAHRASVLGKLRVREVEFIDIPQIAHFFQNLQPKESIWTIEHSILNNQEQQAYVIMSGLTVVGIGVLEPPEQISLLRAKFNMDQYHNHKYHVAVGAKSDFAVVKVVLIYPVFEVHFRYFAREMMRLSGSNTLIWMTSYRNKWAAHKANSLVSTMVPLLPRKCDIAFTDVPELVKLSNIFDKMLAFCTWFLDKKLTSLPIFNVSTKIVVLGASRTAMGFLNALLFGNPATYLSFTNVTMISSYGLPCMRHVNSAAEMMFLQYYNNMNKFLKSVPYTYYVNSVQGTVVEINNTDKYVMLTNGSRYYYDLLFLCFGKQYQHPNYLKPFTDKKARCEKYVRLDIPRSNFETDTTNYDIPENVFIVNEVRHANKALDYVKCCLDEEANAKIIVYGDTINAYCCLSALLETGVPPENLIFVEPFPSEDYTKARVSLFFNSNVDETVSRVMEKLKIKVYRSYYFQSWNVTSNYVTNVVFLSHFRMITLDCSVFFYYGKRGISTEAFYAVNKCGMAYDAGILIDHEFRTRDPFIYAAGPATAYHRKYYAPDMKHKYFDSYEVGETLGKQIRNKLDPLFTEKYSTESETDKCSINSLYYVNGSRSKSSISTFSLQEPESLEYEFTRHKLPEFKRPRVLYCRLPGGLQYLEVRSTGNKIPHYYLQSLHFSGYVMETFKGGYFKIHLNNDLIVDGLTCLTPATTYSVENFQYIFGHSSVVLNNVHLKYDTNKLDDFYEFFRMPWACFLYHDQADELFAMVKELLPKNQHKGDTVQEALRKVKIVQDSSNHIKFDLRNNFEASPYIEAITDYVLQWLSENDILLPMYLQPSQRTDFEHDLDRNPFFRKKKTSLTSLIANIV